LIMKGNHVTQLIFDTYIGVIRNSVKSRMFRNLYAEVGVKKTDVTENGRLSCAFFVSSLLVIFGLIKSAHATVSGTVRDLEKSGWMKISKPKAGSVLVWKAKKNKKGDIHKHIGFYIGKDKAISNNSRFGYPSVHHWTFGKVNKQSKRKIETIFWHGSFE